MRRRPAPTFDTSCGKLDKFAERTLQVNGCLRRYKVWYCYTKGCLNPDHPSVDVKKFKVPAGMGYGLTPKFVAKYEAAIKSRIKAYVVADWGRNLALVKNKVMALMESDPKIKRIIQQKKFSPPHKVTVRLDQWCAGKRESDRLPSQGADNPSRIPLLKVSVLVDFKVDGKRLSRVISLYCTAHRKVSSAKQFDKLPLLDTFCFRAKKNRFMVKPSLQQHFLRTGEEVDEFPPLARSMCLRSGANLKHGCSGANLKQILKCVLQPQCVRSWKKKNNCPTTRARLGASQEDMASAGYGFMKKIRNVVKTVKQKVKNVIKKSIEGVVQGAIASWVIDVADAAIRASISDLRPHMVE